MKKIFIPISTAVIFLLLLWGLIELDSNRPRPTEFVEIPYDNLVGWASDQQGLALIAFQKSCTALLSQPAQRKLSPENIGGRIQDWHKPCRAAQKLTGSTNHEARAFFEQYFTAFSYSQETEGLFTGYFAPEYSGSLKPTDEYRYPLYMVPESLKVLDLGKFSSALKGKTIVGEVRDGEFVPFKDRKNIDSGGLDKLNLEVVWLKDPADSFFMHIQGSGVIRYEDGQRQLFGYAGKNGRVYHSIGKFLIENGAITRENMSMQAIRAWITENPRQAEALMWKNPSYVFFQALDKPAPVGSMNVMLTAGRSLAVDREYVPLGMPIWLDLTPSLEAADPIRRLVIAQDTGGAIKGRVRADIYWGIGEDAGLVAGSMKERGRYYFLLPKNLALRISPESEKPW